MSSPNLNQDILTELRKRGWTLGFAESCTGGLFSSDLTQWPGVSDIFHGAIVAYANDVKINVLGVSPQTLQRVGAVSEATAVEMVRGARRVLAVDCAVSVTGIAGPSGGTKDKPVGLVCIAAAGPNFEVVTTQNFAGDRRQIQQQSLVCGWRLLHEQLRVQALNGQRKK